MADEYMTLTEAADYLKVNRNRLWLLVKAGQITAFSDPLDRRKKLVRKQDVELLLEPRPKE